MVREARELALRHANGDAAETPVPAEAYAPFPKWKPGRPGTWEGLPWKLRSS